VASEESKGEKHGHENRSHRRNAINKAELEIPFTEQGEKESRQPHLEGWFVIVRCAVERKSKPGSGIDPFLDHPGVRYLVAVAHRFHANEMDTEEVRQHSDTGVRDYLQEM
jgi:hypothetical protein